MSKKMRSNILLLITAAVWGAGFVAQKSGAHIGAFTYNGIRTVIAGLFLIPIILILEKVMNKPEGETEKSDLQKKDDKRILIIGGICCGIVLFIASTLQQYGITFTTAGKTGFITSLYMVIVPFLSVILGKKVRPIMWICVVMGAIGLYLLSMTGSEFKLQVGDLFVLICAFAFALHIMVIDYFSPKCNGVKLSCIQFLVAGTIGCICMFIFETPVMKDILDATIPILYAGVVSAGIGYTLQIVAQANAEPTTASLLMSLESVFSVVFGMLLLNEVMSVRELTGCLIIFIAVVLSQLPSKEDRLKVKGN